MYAHNKYNKEISTHTPHTGCDGKGLRKKVLQKMISTHTPHTGCDLLFFFHNQDRI